MYESGFDSAAAQAHLDRQFATIDVIQELMERVSRPPAAGSDVARLDSEVGDTPVTVSKSVHAGLSTATDCLVDIASILRRPDSILTLSSVRSLMRTALLGASRAAFVLVPEQHEDRVAAAEVVVRQEWFSLERAFDALSPFEHLPGLVPPVGFRNEMHDLAKNLPPGRRQGEERTIREMSEVVARKLSGKEIENEPPSLITEALVWIWHSGSGAAHAYGWPRLAGGDFVSDFGMVVPVAHIALDSAVRRWS